MAFYFGRNSRLSSDLDFEYPSNSAQGQGFADLFTELRTAFDNLASSKGDSTPYILSAAVSAGPANYANLVVPQMNSALTFWNLMVSKIQLTLGYDVNSIT